MEVLTLNGKRYVKASKAAKDFGYATDYVGQLCRTGAVDAHLVGRTWYVNPDVLGAHRVEKKRNARSKAREYAKKSIAESKLLTIKQNTKSYNSIAIRYKKDDEDLIPEVKKVSITSEEQIVPVEKNADIESESYTLVNKDKKIIMSGSIPVYDVEEETVLTDTTVLTPRIVRHQTPKLSKVITASEDEATESIPVSQPDFVRESGSVAHTTPTFSERLALQEETSGTPSEAEGTRAIQEIWGQDRLAVVRWYESRISFYIAIAIIALCPLTIFIESRISYSVESTSTSFHFDDKDIKNLLHK